MKVFNIAASVLETHHNIEFSRPRNRRDWIVVDDMVTGKKPADLGFLSSIDIDVPTTKSRPLDDVMSFEANFIVSSRCRMVVEELRPTAVNFFEIKVNGQPWFVMVNHHVIDCIDRSRALIEMKQLGNANIPLIKRYEFHEGRIRNPEIFTIPEKTHLTYCTQGVVSEIEAAGIKGFVFIDTQNPGKWAGMIGDR